jgi:hypothetical protein
MVPALFLSINPAEEGRMMTGRISRVLLGCSLLGLTACFTYTPVQVAEVSPGVMARARLSVPAAARVGETVPLAGRMIEGRVVTGDAVSLLLEVPSARDAAGHSGLTLYQRVQLPLDDVIELELRRVDRWKTGGLVAAGAVAIGFLVVRQFAGGSASSNLPPGGGGPAEVAFPLRLPLGARK